MEFSIGSQFSREFTFEESRIVDLLKVPLNDWFVDKNYGVKKIYFDFICVSKGFDPFFMARPLKHNKKESFLEYEIKLNYDIFFNASYEERLKILRDEFLNKTIEIFNSKKLKDFDVKSFLSDLEDYFKTINIIKNEQ
jgi:hypothetical protein